MKLAVGDHVLRVVEGADVPIVGHRDEVPAGSLSVN